MAKETKKHMNSKGGNKRVATNPKTTAAVKVAKGVLAQASRQTADGKFTKVIFRQIGAN